MTFPAAGGTSFPLTLEAAWAAAGQAAKSVRAQAVALQSQINAGPVSAQVILNNQVFFVTLNNQLTTYAAVPGIAAYAQGQVNNTNTDIAGAFTAMQNALVAVGTWIVTNFPVDSGGFLQAQQFVGGVPTFVNFSSAQLAGLNSALTSLIATIS